MEFSRLYAFVSFLGIILLAGIPVTGQVITGNIVGTVSDATGGVLPGAEVTIRSPALIGGTATTSTNDKGRYRFPALVPGTYRLKIHKIGFTNYVDEAVRVQVGSRVEKNVFLGLAAVSEEVTVSGEGPVVDTQKSAVSTNYGKEYMENVPLRRSGINDFIKSAPGISATYTTYNQHPAVSALGSGVNENIYLVDGSSTLDYAGPGSGPGRGPGTDAIEEIEILSLGASAEYGNFQGAVFNVVTRQGGNDWHFDGSYYYTSQNLTSQPVRRECNCTEGETGFTRDRFYDFALHAGGPILKDRLWIFGGYGYQQDYKCQPGDDPRRPEEWISDQMLWKLTWQITPELKSIHSFHSGSARYPLPPNAYAPYEVMAAYIWDDATFTFANLIHTVTDNTLWDLRVSGSFPDFDTEPNSGNRTEPLRFDLATNKYTGGSIGIHTGRGKGLSVRGKVSHYAEDFLSGDHDFKFGVQLEYEKTRTSYMYPGGALYYDYAGQPYYAWFREPYSYGGGFHNIGAFVEDAYHVGERLTLNLGLRFDYNRAFSPNVPALNSLGEETEDTIEGLGTLYTWNRLSPRLGFNLALTEDGRTLLRGTWGRYYQGVNTHVLKWTHPAITPGIWADYDPATGEYSDIVSYSDQTQYYAIDPDMKTPRTDQFSVGLDREIAPDMVMGLTYSRKDGRHFTGWEDVLGVYGTDRVTFPDGRTLTVYPLISEPWDRRFVLTNPEEYYLTYNGMLLTLNKRWAGRWQMLVSYTLSEASGLQASQGLYSQNSAGGFQRYGRDPNDLINADGTLSNDRTHMVRAQGALMVPKLDVTLGVNFQHLTGKPWMAKTYLRLPQGRQRVFLEPRGSRRHSSQTLLDVRLAKTFRFGKRLKLELLADILNLLNETAEVHLLTDDYYRPEFAEPVRFVEPRSVMLGIKFSF